MTMAGVLAPFDVAENDFAAELARDLRAAPDEAACGLSEEQAAMLARHGGIVAPARTAQPPTGRETLRASSSNLAEQTRTSMSVAQAARLLQVDPSRVRHRVRDHALHGF